MLAGAPVPQGLRCIGTEPFWSVRFSADGVTHDTPEGGETAVSLSVAAWPEGPGLPLPVRLTAEGLDLAGLLDHAACSDGMSDRPYGWTLTLGRRGGAEAGPVRSGCCFLPRGG
jgi:uncharacterized membrane protein